MTTENAETFRLSTFKNWALNDPCPEELASAGYTMVAPGVVQCKFCGVTNVKEGEFAMHLHKYPCLFISDYSAFRSRITWADWTPTLNYSCSWAKSTWIDEEVMSAVRRAAKDGLVFTEEMFNKAYHKGSVKATFFINSIPRRTRTVSI